MRCRTPITAALLALAMLATAAPVAAGDSAVDVTPRQTRLEGGPEGLIAGSPVVFDYGSDDYSAEFECSLDGGPFAPCGFEEERIETPLADGPHTFKVRAVDQAGNVDPSPAVRSFRVDGTPPTLKLTEAPYGLVRDPRPVFRFKASGEDKLRCRLSSEDLGPDPYPPGPCTGPDFFRPPRPLPDDSYEFRVWVTDRAGNEASAARGFRIYTQPGTPPSPFAGSVLYRGGAEGIKVAFRVKHRRLIWAKALVRLRCIGPNGRRHPGRRKLWFAEPGWGALPLNARDRFRWVDSSEEPGLRIEENLVGTVHRRFVVGRLHYYQGLGYRDLRCHTGTRSKGTLGFRARRVRR
jgi:hypothetical protein